MHLRYLLLTTLFLDACQSTNFNQTFTSAKLNDNFQANLSANEAINSQNGNIAKQHEKVITPQDESDLWRRIARQFTFNIPDHDDITKYRNWYLKHPSHLETVTNRAKPFLYLITQKIEKSKLPLELALLPIVESSFDAFAYSNGSAAGLWQFIPSTGKSMGLEQTYWYDGRRDVVASTDAALNYLTKLTNRFDGDWLLGIAAYNSGGGRISSAIKKNKKLGKPTDFFSLDLPRETSSYVPKLLALIDLIANQEKYGITLSMIENKSVLTLVDPKEQLDLAIAAQYAGISLKELHSYNPAYNHWATAPKKYHKLLIPIEKKQQFKQQASKNHGQGLKWVRYQVKSGDVLSVIAQKFNTSTELVRDANQLHPKDTIKPKQFLMIPTALKDENDYALSSVNRLEKIQSKGNGQYKFTHKVVAGDSLWLIAKKNKVTVAELAKWNAMAPNDPLRQGQKLVIWKKAKGKVIRTVYYQVKSGDNISTIAKKFKVKASDVIIWNKLHNTKYLQPKQQLVLHVDVTKTSATNL